MKPDHETCSYSLRRESRRTHEPVSVDARSTSGQHGSMEASIDTPASMLKEAMEITGARTKPEAVVTAVADFNRRARMAALVRHLGTCDNLISAAELDELRGTP